MFEQHITPQTRPNLDWNPHPRGMYVARELIQSDAYRRLSKSESDFLLFILSRRSFPNRKKKMKKKAGAMNYWHPINGQDMTIPFKAVKEFFDKPGVMKRGAPNNSTITRAINKLMQLGFLSIVHLGGNGKGDMSVYRLENNWRVWRDGDEPCFVRAGMSRGKGFCQPGSETFFRKRNQIKK